MLVFVTNIYFISRIVVESVIVIFLGGLVLTHLLKMVGCRLVSCDIDVITKEAWHRTRGRSIVFIVHDFKGKRACCGDSLMFC